MKVLHDKGIFSIEGITVINPLLLPNVYYKDNLLHIDGVEPGEPFDLPENIIAELDEIDTVEDGGGCYVAGSKTVYRLKLKEPLVDTGSKETQEQLWKEVFHQTASRMDFMSFLVKHFHLTRK